jgi:hypothetical protein
MSAGEGQHLTHAGHRDRRRDEAGRYARDRVTGGALAREEVPGSDRLREVPAEVRGG